MMNTAKTIKTITLHQKMKRNGNLKQQEKKNAKRISLINSKVCY